MTFDTAKRILKMQGYDRIISVIDGDLVESVNRPEESYHCIKKDNSKWKFLCVHNERDKRVELLGEFNTCSSATRIFILNRLSSLFLYKEVLPGKNE